MARDAMANRPHRNSVGLAKLHKKERTSVSVTMIAGDEASNESSEPRIVEVESEPNRVQICATRVKQVALAGEQQTSELRAQAMPFAQRVRPDLPWRCGGGAPFSAQKGAVQRRTREWHGMRDAGRACAGAHARVLLGKYLRYNVVSYARTTWDR